MTQNNKKTCSECGRFLRNRCFVYNKVIKKEICRTCNKRLGNNIFYTPEPKVRGATPRKTTKQKYTDSTNYFSLEEKQYLYKKLREQGYTHEQSNQMIKERIQKARQRCGY